MRNLNFFLVGVLLVVIVVTCEDARAGGDDIIQSNDNNTQTAGDISTGDTVVGGDDSLGLGLSNSLGDVDIAGCLGSTQWNTPLFGKQKLVLNWPCMAEFYLRHQKWELAAMAICNTEMVQEFSSEAACEAAHDFSAFHVEPSATLEIEHEEELGELEEDIDDLEAQIEQQQIQIQQLQEAPARVVVKDRDHELAELLRDDAERRARAKQILEGKEDG